MSTKSPWFDFMQETKLSVEKNFKGYISDRKMFEKI